MRSAQEFRTFVVLHMLSLTSLSPLDSLNLGCNVSVSCEAHFPFSCREQVSSSKSSLEGKGRTLNKSSYKGEDSPYLVAPGVHSLDTGPKGLLPAQMTRPFGEASDRGGLFFLRHPYKGLTSEVPRYGIQRKDEGIEEGTRMGAPHLSV